MNLKDVPLDKLQKELERRGVPMRWINERVVMISIDKEKKNANYWGREMRTVSGQSDS